MTTATTPQDRHYKFLRALAQDMSAGEVSFPTFTGATLRVRTALADPEIDVERLTTVISSEPLLPARLIRIANSVAGGGKAINDVRTAVMRVGHDVVRSTAVAVAMAQLRSARDVQRFSREAEWTWRHSLKTAAIAFVLAKKLSRLNPDEAMFAGLVHDIGRFYLLARAGADPDFADNPAGLEAIVHEWHAPIGQSLLHSFHLSDAVLKAIGEHEDHHPKLPPREMCDVIAIANLVAHHMHPGKQGMPAHLDVKLLDDPALQKAVAESAEEIQAVFSALQA